MAFGRDGRLYAVAAGESKLVAYTPDGAMEVVAEGFKGNDLIVRNDGKIYVTEPSSGDSLPSKIWLIQPDGAKVLVDSGLKSSSGIALSPDQSLLYVTDSKSHWVYSFQIQPDGKLAHKQRFFRMMMPDMADDSGADGIEVDREGKVYVATRMGIQVCDSAGRVQCILPAPHRQISSIAFGGPGGDTLYAACGDKIYQRKLRIRGVQSFSPPLEHTKANGG
jgi:sugar lactone lactonase YvrE